MAGELNWGPTLAEILAQAEARAEAAEARAAELERKLAEAVEWQRDQLVLNDDASALIKRQRAAIDDLTRRLSTAVEALKPFSVHAGKFGSFWMNHDRMMSGLASAGEDRCFTIGDLRRAAAIVEAGEDR